MVVLYHRFLGSLIGNSVEKRGYIEHKVNEWTKAVEKLSKAAVKQHQAAYVALTKSLQNDWKYLQRVILDHDHSFQQLNISFFGDFIRNLIGHEVSPNEEELFSLPTSYAEFRN